METISAYLEKISLLPSHNVIYALLDPDTLNIRYVGKAEVLRERIKKHYKPSELRRGLTHKNNWLNFLLSQGKRALVSVIEICNSVEALNDAEKKWIAHFKSIGCDLTNGTEGGTGGKLSPEAIAKMAASKKGKRLSEAHRKAISAGQMGRISGMNGKHQTEEAKQKISEGNKGKTVSNEALQNMSVAQKKAGARPEVRAGRSQRAKAYQASEQKRKADIGITGHISRVLTQAQIEEAISLRRSMTITELARKYGVSRSMIGRITTEDWIGFDVADDLPLNRAAPLTKQTYKRSK